MKPFNLEKALAGEPVVLRNGYKAYVKYNLLDHSDLKRNISYPLYGFYIVAGNEPVIQSWTVEGLIKELSETNYDIIGMWEEPRPTVTLTLPCPIKKPRDEMWHIDAFCEHIFRSNCDKNMNLDTFNRLIYFASKEDAQAWFDAMRDSRR